MTGRRAGLGAAVAALVVWSVAPAAWQVLTALKPDRDITRTPTVYLPHPPTWKHVEALWERKPFGVYLANSAAISGAATLLSLVLAAPAASALGRSPERRRRTILRALAVLTLFPPILLLFPLYEAVRALGGLNRPLALVLPYAALSLPLAIWILERGFGQIPAAVGEAAILDGLGARPPRRENPAPARHAVARDGGDPRLHILLERVHAGADVHDAGSGEDGHRRDRQRQRILHVRDPLGQLSAAIVIATLPLVLLVLLFERRIASGLTRGAIKG